jgi:ribosome maturation factor RimP
MTLKEQISALISAPIEGEGFEVIELRLSRFRGRGRLQLFIDSDNGVKIDDCVRISKLVEPIIDASSLFRYGYVIEVSSPGLDRPLQAARDFRRRIGEKVEIFFNDTELAPFRGELIGANEQHIELQTGEGKSRYSLVDVRMGKIIF